MNNKLYEKISEKTRLTLYNKISKQISKKLLNQINNNFAGILFTGLWRNYYYNVQYTIRKEIK
jgi:hypothetical protein